MASVAATLLSVFLVAAGFAYLAGAFYELEDWRIAAGALLMFTGAVMTRLLPVLYGYESWRGGSVAGPELRRPIHAAIRAARVWGGLLVEEREIEHMTQHQEKVPWCEHCWPGSVRG